MLGLIGGALSGGAQAANDVADNTIQKKRENALLKLKENMQLRAEERESKRGAAATAAEWARDDQLTQKERDWKEQQAALERSHDVRIAGIRANSGYGSSPPSRVKEVEYLVENGIYPDRESAWQAVRTSAGSYDEAGAAQDALKYYTGQINEIDEILSAPGAQNAMTDEQIEELSSERERLTNQVSALEDKAYSGLINSNMPTPTPVPQPQPQPAPSPAPARSNQGGNQGLRPGPSSAGTPTNRADAILNSILNQ